MSDTIELLEAIGKSALLRHAPAGELAAMLERAQASGVLAMAVASGDSSLLSREFGHRPMQAPQVSQAPGQEDEPDREGDDEPQPSRLPGQLPSSP